MTTTTTLPRITDPAVQDIARRYPDVEMDILLAGLYRHARRRATTHIPDIGDPIALLERHARTWQARAEEEARDRAEEEAAKAARRSAGARRAAATRRYRKAFNAWAAQYHEDDLHRHLDDPDCPRLEDYT